jgi:hypothetical protein
VRPAPGVRFTTLTITCPGRVQAEQDVDDADVFQVGPGCRATAEVDGVRRALTLPDGPPGSVRCDAVGRCVR